jgi:hypothetical protein
MGRLSSVCHNKEASLRRQEEVCGTNVTVCMRDIDPSVRSRGAATVILDLRETRHDGFARIIFGVDGLGSKNDAASLAGPELHQEEQAAWAYSITGPIAWLQVCSGPADLGYVARMTRVHTGWRRWRRGFIVVQDQRCLIWIVLLQGCEIAIHLQRICSNPTGQPGSLKLHVGPWAEGCIGVPNNPDLIANRKHPYIAVRRSWAVAAGQLVRDHRG